MTELGGSHTALLPLTQVLWGPPCFTLYTRSATPHVPIMPCRFSLRPPCPGGVSRGEEPPSAGPGVSPVLAVSGMTLMGSIV